MLLTKLLQKDYTKNSDGYQLKLPLNLETIIPDNDSVRLLSQFVEAMDLTDLYSTYERINSVSPRTLLKIVLYSYMNGDYSSRSMELNCKRDINFMFLLEGQPAPDHATFARFRSIHFAPCSKRILAEMSNTLFELGEVSGETVFIDGTKIEASANKYTFVWKKAVTKNQEKLLVKLADFVAECEQLYDIKIVYGNTIKMKYVKKLRKKLYALLLLHTGMRVGEMIALRWRDWKGDYLVIEKSVSTAKNRNKKSEDENNYISLEGNTKNQKARNIQLNREAKYILWKLKHSRESCEQDDLIVPTKTGKMNTASNLEHRMKVIMKNAGLEDVKGGLHIFRKTFATKMYENGARVEEIAAYIGDLPSTTQKYYIAIRRKVVADGEMHQIVRLPGSKNDEEPVA